MLKDLSDKLRVGDSAPDFELGTADGATISSSELRGKALLIVFLRGTW